jgi:hypothetical protein
VSDRLYNLLPAIYRMRDAAQGEPLRAVLSVISEQVDLVEADIARLYDNWFIETCDDWVVPYIGDLIGYTPVLEAGQAPATTSREADLKDRILFPRAEVAATLEYRARKGTLALLGSLADGVAGWPALAVEFYQRLMWTQHADHLRLGRGRTIDLRDGDALDRLGGAFDRAAHGADIRRPDSRHTPGRFNIPSVGVFVWRLKSYSVTHAPAYCVEADGPHCFSFSVLGNDTQLFNAVEADAGQARRERAVPQPIRRRALEERVTQHPPVTRASADFYGAGKSLAVYAPDWPVKGAPQPIPRDLVIPADLTDWRYRVAKGQIAVDPVRGRIIFPTGQLPRRGAWVDYRYGFSADMGGGEYERTVSQPVTFTLYRVAVAGTDKDISLTINAALARWRGEQQDLGVEPPQDAPEHAAWLAAHETLRAAVIEIQDSAAYTEPLTVALAAGESLQIRAASGCRPTLRVLDYMTERSDALAISGAQGSRFKLDGLTVTGRGIAVHGPDRDDPKEAAQGDLCDVTIRHCTLVPGWGLDCGCEPTRPNEPSLEIFASSAAIRIESSIIGSIHVTADETAADPVSISISDSIVDATGAARLAIGAPDLPLAFARLTVLRSTVIGTVGAHAIARAENSIFLGPITVGRRQQGCMRFCYVEPGSRTPRRYRCQPDTALAALCPNLPDGAARQAAEQSRVRPCFNSTRYGTPTYCQLATDCAQEITGGADDESEMGAFHDLFQPQRAANLRARIDEYTPAGLDVAILFAS